MTSDLFMISKRVLIVFFMILVITLFTAITLSAKGYLMVEYKQATSTRPSFTGSGNGCLFLCAGINTCFAYPFINARRYASCLFIHSFIKSFCLHFLDRGLYLFDAL